MRPPRLKQPAGILSNKAASDKEWLYTTVRDFFSLIPPDLWATAQGRPILYFDVDDSFYWCDDFPLSVEVTFLDNGMATVGLDYHQPPHNVKYKFTTHESKCWVIEKCQNELE